MCVCVCVCVCGAELLATYIFPLVHNYCHTASGATGCSIFSSTQVSRPHCRHLLKLHALTPGGATYLCALGVCVLCNLCVCVCVCVCVCCVTCVCVCVCVCVYVCVCVCCVTCVCVCV